MMTEIVTFLTQGDRNTPSDSLHRPPHDLLYLHLIRIDPHGQPQPLPILSRKN
jgi:hypothetical protein